MNAGDRLGRFELKSRLDQGGPGMAESEVFLANSARRLEDVILKLISTAVEDQDALEAEKRGAELQQQLSQRLAQVAKVYDLGVLNDYFYVEMEYVQGQDLTQLLRAEGGRLPASRAARIALNLCEVLEACHQFEGALRGERFSAVLHCDLKPENIRLTEDDNVKIIDFGTATYLTPTRRFTEVSFGSPPYTSPERLKGDGKVDALADLWAVGVLLYLMASGFEPFESRDEEEQKQHIVAGKLLPLPSYVDGRLAQIIRRSLEWDPSSRYLTARAFKEDLRAFLEGRPLAPAAASSKTRRVARPSEGSRAPETSEVETTAPPPGEPVAEPVVQAAAQSEIPEVPPRKAPSAARFWLWGLVLVALIPIGCQAYGYAEGQKLLREAKALAKPRLEDLPRVDRLLVRLRQLEAVCPLAPGRADLRANVLQAATKGVEAVIDGYWRDTSKGNLERWRLAQAVLAEALRLRSRSKKPTPFGEQELRKWEQYLLGQAQRLQAVKNQKDGDSPQEIERARSSSISAFRRALEIEPCWPHPYRGLLLVFSYDFFRFDELATTVQEVEACGIAIGGTELAAVADGMLKQAKIDYETAKSARGQDGERAALVTARGRYEAAMFRYQKLGSFGQARRSLAECKLALQQIGQRLTHLDLEAMSGVSDE